MGELRGRLPRSGEALPPNSAIISHNLFAAQWVSGRHARVPAKVPCSTTATPEASRPVFVIVPTPEALKLTGRKVELPEHYRLGVLVFRNRFYAVYRAVSGCPGEENPPDPGRRSAAGSPIV